MQPGRSGIICLIVLLASVTSAHAARMTGGSVIHLSVNNSGGGVWDVSPPGRPHQHLVVSTGSPAVLGVSCANPDHCPGSYSLVGLNPGTLHQGGWLSLGWVDRIPPEIAAPPDLTVEQESLQGTVLSFADPRLRPLVSDNHDREVDVLVQIPGVIQLTPVEQMDGGRLLDRVGEVAFPLGQTQVLFTAVDDSDNRTPARMTVTVVDTTPPDLAVPAELIVEAEGPDGVAVALPEPSILADDCDAQPDLEVIGLPEDGVFPLYDEQGQAGATWVVTYRATDASGNVVEREMVVRVIDSTPPSILLATNDLVLEQDQRCGTELGELPGAVVADAGTAPEDLVVEVTQDGRPIDAGTCFPLGAAAIEYRVTDRAGNSASAVLALLVQDTTKPAVTEVSFPERIYHNTPREFVVAVHDICDADPEVTVEQMDRALVRDPQEPDYYSALYASEGVYDVAWTALDETGNRTVTQNRRFAIDRRPPQVTYEGIPQHGVDPLDPMTYPALFRGEKIDTLVSGDDDPEHLGTFSGFAHISATIDPDTGPDAPVLFQRSCSPVEGTDPLQGPATVKNLQCENRAICNKFSQLEPGRLEPGDHVLVVRAADRAGNVRTQAHYFNVLNLRLALEQAYFTIRRLLVLPETPAPARQILEQDLLLIGYDPRVGIDPEATYSAAYFSTLLWELPIEYGDRSWLELGNVVLYLNMVLKDLARVNENWVDTSLLLRNLSMAAIAEAELLYDWTAQEVEELDRDDLDREVGAARGHLDQARADQQAGSYQAAMLQLGHALFRLQNAFAPVTADDLAGVLSLGWRLYDEMDVYYRIDGINGGDVIEDILRSYLGRAMVLLRRFDGPIPTDTWIELLLDLVEISELLAEAQRQFVWVRFWQWELTHLVKWTVDAARLVACTDSFPEEDTPPCPDNSGIDLLEEAQCRYHAGIAELYERDVDSALDVYIGARCLMETIFDEQYNQPVGGFRPYPHISIDPDCPDRAGLFLYEYTLLVGDEDPQDGVQDFRCTLR